MRTLSLVRLAAALLFAPLALAAQQPTRPTRPAPRPAPATPAPAPQPAAETLPPPPAVGRLIGLLVDSVHVKPLVGATVHLRQTLLFGETNQRGIFVIDSIPAGEYVAGVSHPLLDSLYLSIVTPPIRITADSITEMALVIPSFATLMGGECPPATANLGPATFAGRVMDSETRQPASGVRVALVWTQISVGETIGLRRAPRVRTAVTDARGYYRICGIPDDLEDATIQAERGRVKTAEVPVSMRGSLSGLRSMLIRPVADSLTKTGKSVVLGRVVDTVGLPVLGAQVSVEGATAVTVTNDRGEFRLDSLPSGTQALVIRKIGLAPSQTIVDLVGTAPVRVSVNLKKAVPLLQSVVVTARAEALSKVGFEERQRRGMGRFLSPEDIERIKPLRVTDAFRTIPGLRIVPTSSGRSTITSSRDATGGCVNYWVDGSPFKEMEAGELDMTFTGSTITAAEVYQPTDTPAQFTSAGTSSCTTIVIWTEASIRRKR